MSDEVEAALDQEREVILHILIKASNQRDCFHCSGETMKNAAGNSLFIDATRIDAVIEKIKARRALPTGFRT